jgi:hypothetical protein
MSKNIVSGIVSSIAAAIIEERLRKGRTIYIPSLGITIKGKPPEKPAEETQR